MEKEIIIHKDRKVLKKKKKNGEVTYSLKGAYLGVDDKTGKQVTTTITAKTLKALERKLQEARIDFENNGSTKKEKTQVVLLRDLALIWFESYKTWVTSENTINRVDGYVNNYIIPKFGDYKIEKIEPSDIQSWVNELAKKHKLSADSGNKKSPKGSTQDFGAVVHKLSDIFDFAVTNFGLASNPAKSIKIPSRQSRKNKKVKVLHDRELAIWMEYLTTLQDTRANRRFKVICDTLLSSGLRINELLALTKNDLNFLTSKINVDKTLVWKKANKKLGTKGKVICKKTPKTDAGNRSVPVPKEILMGLESVHREMNTYFEKHNLPLSILIFTTIYGNYMTDRNERATLKKRLAEAGLPIYGFHLFRHTHASLMLNAGVNWKELQIRMGHKSISTTMDLYAELAPNKKYEAVDIYLNKINEITKSP